MKQLISRPVQKWGATMTMIMLVAFILLVVGAALIVLMPPESYGTILAIEAVLAIGLAIVLGRVIRWLTQD